MTNESIDSMVHSQSGTEENDAIVETPQNQCIRLSPAQKRLRFIDRLMGSDSSYNIPMALMLNGPLNVECLKQAVAHLGVQHPILCAKFTDETDTYQEIEKNCAIRLEIARAQQDETDPPADYWRAAANFAAEPFDLSVPPMLRAKLFPVAANRALLVVVVHHIVADGWSIALIGKDLSENYTKLVNGHKLSAGPSGADYGDLIYARQKLVSETEYAEKLGFLIERLRSAPPKSSFGYALPKNEPVETKAHRFKLDAEDGKSFGLFMRKQRSTLFVGLLAAFNSILARCTNQYDLVIGTSVAARHDESAYEAVGLFANTLAIRCDIDLQAPLPELFRKTGKSLAQFMDRSSVSFDEVVRGLGLGGNQDHSSLFQISFELETGQRHETSFGELTMEPVRLDGTHAKFELVIECIKQSDGGVWIDFEFPDIAGADEFYRLVGARYRRLLIELATGEHENMIGALHAAESDEAAQVLEEWTHGPELAHPAPTALHLFAKQVELTPDSIAVSYAERSMTYQELDKASNRIANGLLERPQYKKEIRVGLLMSRTDSYLIAVLGVLKAGGAFVPLGTSFPSERVAQIALQAGCDLVLAEPSQIAAFGEHIPCPLESFAEWQDQSSQSPAVEIEPTDLAYIMSTSGSTGRPKAVMVEHEGLLNHLLAKIHDFGIGPDDVIAEMAATTFDVSVWQYLIALVVGGRTVVLEDELAWEPEALVRAITEHEITIVESVPTHTALILAHLETLETPPDLNTLRFYISNAEALPPEQTRRWFKLLPNIPLVNTYGATEASDDTSHYIMTDAVDADATFVSIAGTVANMATHLLDRDLQVVPPGVVGEIYLGGIGVGRGYAGDTSRTAAQFLPDPFTKRPGARLYRTGDLGRYHTDGSLEFVGRVDQQIKLRGHRIELGEIETVILRHPNVDACAIVVGNEGTSSAFLCAYIVPQRHPAPDIAEINLHCAKSLPAYMVPAALLCLDALPLNSNGKVDKAKLPAVASRVSGQIGPTDPPQGKMEQAVARIWSEALNVTQIGREDNFFDLGGHSLLTVEVMAHVHRELGLKAQVRALFEAPRLKDFAAFLDRLDTGQEILPTDSHQPLLSDDEVFDLAPIQIPEWFAHKLAPTSPVYNISLSDAFFIGLDLPRFIETWQIIIKRHLVFRLAIKTKNGRPFHQVIEETDLSEEGVVLDRSHLTGPAVLDEARKLAEDISNTVFDFESGPLFRLQIARYGDGRYQLLFCVHHIIWDETSTMNLMGEFAEIYNALGGERTPNLRQLHANYAGFSHWLGERIESGALEASRRYWKDVLSDPPEPLKLPTDLPRPSLPDYSGDTVKAWLPRATVNSLRGYCRNQNTTLFMHMMAVIGTFLYRVSGSRDFVLGCPFAGRDEDPLKPLLGLFAGPVPIRLKIEDSMSFDDLVAQVRMLCINAYEHHSYPCNLVIEELQLGRDLSRNKLFSIMYGVQNNKTDLARHLIFDDMTINWEDTYNAEAHSARFDLTIAVEEEGSDISIRIIYPTSLYRRETIETWMASILELSESALRSPQLPLGALNMMTAETRLLIEDYSAGPVLPVPTRRVEHLLFERAAAAPDDAYLRLENGDISYGEAARCVLAAASWLSDDGIEPGDVVGLLFDQEPIAIIAQFAVLALGATFVPLSPKHPPERILKICRSAGVVRIIGSTTEAAHLSDKGGDLPFIAMPTIRDLAGIEPIELLAQSSDATAAIFFTSGTTGEPKGIPLTHTGILNVLHSTQSAHGFTSADRFAWTTSSVFDPALLEVFWPTISGGSIVVPRRATLIGAGEMVDMLSRGATILQCVPAQLPALLDALGGDASKALDLRLIIVGGAPLRRALAARTQELFPGVLRNHYGPTETTVDACRFDFGDNYDSDIVPIGRPIENCRVHILDEFGAMALPGVPGEIWIESPGLTPGYIVAEGTPYQACAAPLPDRPELAFATGDIGKWNHNGNIVFLGRRDKQFKIAGARVELEEIDSVILRHPQVKDCVTRHWQKDDDDMSGQLISFVELQPDCCEYCDETGTFGYETLQQNSRLQAEIGRLGVASWAPFFEGDRSLRDLWPTLQAKYPQHQVRLSDAEGATVAIIHMASTRWDGTIDALPKGWSAALEQCVGDPQPDSLHDCLVIFAGMVAPGFKGRNLGAMLIRFMKRWAEIHGFSRIAAPVRPSHKHADDGMGFEEYCTARRPDGQLLDPWLRLHERGGGIHIRADLQSQRITGSHADWLKWTGLNLAEGENLTVPGTLMPVRWNAAGDVGIYDEPCMWVSYDIANTAGASKTKPLTQDGLRRFILTQLPSYMMPNQIELRRSLPRTAGGKVDEAALTMEAPMAALQACSLTTDTENRIGRIWGSFFDPSNIHLYADFFELGGQSMDVIEMLSKVEDEFDLQIVISEFYEETTINNLARIIENNLARIGSDDAA